MFPSWSMMRQLGDPFSRLSLPLLVCQMRCWGWGNLLSQFLVRIRSTEM